MSRIRQVRETHRSPHEVFSYVADLTTIAEWDPSVRSARRLDEGPLGIGARFEVIVRFLMRTLPMEYQIVAFDPPRRVAFEGTSAQSSAKDIVLFESVADRTRITWTLDIELNGAGRLVAPFLGPPLRRLGNNALDGLEKRLRQDGPLPTLDSHRTSNP